MIDVDVLTLSMSRVLICLASSTISWFDSVLKSIASILCRHSGNRGYMASVRITDACVLANLHVFDNYYGDKVKQLGH